MRGVGPGESGGRCRCLARIKNQWHARAGGFAVLRGRAWCDLCCNPAISIVWGMTPVTHREKVTYAIEDLAQRGVDTSTSAPPAWRVAWALGVKIPPPHFMGFASIALTSGILFGVLWGLLIWYLLWHSRGWLFTASAATLAGAAYGLLMASCYRYSATKLELPTWKQYPGPELSTVND
jgi:Family of unknown function (DUF6404)